MKRIIGIFCAFVLLFNSASADSLSIHRSVIATDGTFLEKEGKEGSWFYNNETSVADGNLYGGLFYVTGGGRIRFIRDFYFFNNTEAESTTGSVYGGVLANESESPDGYITNTGFTENRVIAAGVEAYGGAIYNAGSLGDISANAAGFDGNYAKNNYVFDNQDPSAVGKARGGAIYNSGSVGKISGTFAGNYAQAGADGDARGGAIYNSGSVNGAISSNFTDNHAAAGADGTALGGAIYTTGSLDFLASVANYSFSGNYTQVGGGPQIANAIYASGAGLTLTFRTIGGHTITFDDQIEGNTNGEIDSDGADAVYNIRITGDKSSGSGTIFNNKIINAGTVTVINSNLVFGSGGAFQGADKINLVLNDGDLYSTNGGLDLAGLSMGNNSNIFMGANSLNAESFRFFGADSSITSTNGGLDFSDKNLTFDITGVGAGKTMLDFKGAGMQIGGGGLFFTIVINPDNFSLDEEDYIFLIASSTGNTLNNGNGSARYEYAEDEEYEVSGLGVSVEYDYDLIYENNKLVFRINSMSVNPQSKSFSEGMLAGLAFANQSADLIAGTGIANAVRAARNESGHKYAAFAAGGASQSRYKTGSHIDVGGYSAVAGFAVEVDDGFVLGAFAEYGKGKYDAMNDFAGASPSVKATGRTDYIGGGVLLHLGGRTGAYAEGAVKGGITSTGYESDDFCKKGVCGQTASFDTDATYFGGHAGVGFVSEMFLGELDFSAKYLATVQTGHDAKISSGGATETIKFGGAVSQRVRGGAKLTLGGLIFRPFAAAYADYEFGGGQSATLSGFDVASPSLAGLTGIAQAGLAIEMEEFSIMAGGEGYVGVRTGFGLMGSFKYRFGMDSESKAKAESLENESVRASSAFPADGQSDSVRASSPSFADRDITHAVFASETDRAMYGRRGGRYTIQVGAYYSETGARAVVNKISSVGAATIEQEGDLYKVRIRGLSGREARKAAERLRNEHNMAPGLIRDGRWGNTDKISDD